MNQSNKYDVFISYSRKDKRVVNMFVDRLTREGFYVWIDKDGIESGDAFKHVIVNAIEQSSVVVFFSSEASNTSLWTSKEIGVAIYENKPIIPVKLDNARYNSEIKFDLINLDYIELRGGVPTEEVYARLVKTLRHKCNKPGDESEKPEKPKRPEKPGNITPSRFSISFTLLVLFTVVMTGFIGSLFWLLVLFSYCSKNHRRLWEWTWGHQRQLWIAMVVICVIVFIYVVSSDLNSSPDDDPYYWDTVAAEELVAPEIYVEDFSYDTIAADTTVVVEDWTAAVAE